jgi:Anti-sigma factor NepR
VDRDSNKKDRRRKMPGADKMDQARSSGAHMLDNPPGAESDGLSPSLQAHIGRHVRAVFDEVAREPIPEHLLRLLKDLERSGDK